eukprot:m.355222 g.355222  ORF g.355222 m.355222 type:complete len:161 (+) comp17198_c0_seq1:261-743(+)
MAEVSTPPVQTQSLVDAYAEPEDNLELEVCDPKTQEIGGKKFTDYEIKLTTNMPIFKKQNSSVRRRYSDFVWLKSELERDSRIAVPELPEKGLSRQMPWVSAEKGIFGAEFIEQRRQGLQDFITRVAGHPLAQNQKSLHMFLQEEEIDRTYTPGPIRGRK